MNKHTSQVQLKALNILRAVEELGVASKLDDNKIFSAQLDKIFEMIVSQVYQEADEWGEEKNANKNHRPY